MAMHTCSLHTQRAPMGEAAVAMSAGIQSWGQESKRARRKFALFVGRGLAHTSIVLLTLSRSFKCLRFSFCLKVTRSCRQPAGCWGLRRQGFLHQFRPVLCWEEYWFQTWLWDHEVTQCSAQLGKASDSRNHEIIFEL